MRKELTLERELKKFEDLEKEIDETLKMLNDIISLFSNKTEVAKGNATKLAKLLEQKIALLTRKESLIKNMADVKRAVHNVNIKSEDAEVGETNLAKLILEYTHSVRELREAKETLEDAANEDELKDFFG